jgi:hypothetical protein
MNNKLLADYLIDAFRWRLDYYDINVTELGHDIALDLERNGYCTDPYLDFDKALMCPINKRREKYCGCTSCNSYEFCTMLRREGYIK